MSELGQSGKATLLGPLSEAAPPLSKAIVLAKWQSPDGEPRRVTIHVQGSDASVPAIVPPLTYQRSVTMYQARVTFGGQSRYIELDGTGVQTLTVVGEAVELYAAWDRRAFDRMLTLSPGHVTLWSPVNDMAGAIVEGPGTSIAQRTDWYAVEPAPIPAGTSELLAPWAPLSLAVMNPNGVGAVAVAFYHGQTLIENAVMSSAPASPIAVPPHTTRALVTPVDAGAGMGFVWSYGLPNALPSPF
jgi:hypothetical protein